MPDLRDPRRQPQDVTEQFAGQLPVPPPRLFMDAQDTKELYPQAFQSDYLGHLTEAEAKEVINRHFTCTRGTDLHLNMIAHDARFGYDGKYAAVVRHAVELLIRYYSENHGLLDPNDQTLQQRIRERAMAERAKKRKELREAITVYDEEMRQARVTGDYQHISTQLAEYSRMLLYTRRSSQSQWKVLNDIFVSSVETRLAASTFYNWVRDLDHAQPEDWDTIDWHKLAREWNSFYEDQIPDE